MAKEINLVPDIKNEFIKTLKFRNLVFFLCIIIASSSLIIILIFISISGGQQGFINAKKTTIETLQQKISDYNDLSDFLTIGDQLNNISEITKNKVLVSRSFNILSALIPTGSDYINISELSVNLSDDAPTFTFDAQANANSEPYIDYRVLDSFKKSMQYMRYDYGEYIDRYDNVIPAYCIVESGDDGATFKDPAKGYYALWLIDGDGCNAMYEEPEEEKIDSESESGSNSNSDKKSSSLFKQNTDLTNPNSEATNTENLSLEEILAKRNAEKIAAAREASHNGYTLETYQDQNVVRIWRTPQYSEWYKSKPKDNEPYMDLEGNIYNMAHFKSACITYSGTANENGTVTWSTANETCKLVPGDDESSGISIESSSNGRDSNDDLVLRFSAVITFAPEVFNFNNHHMLALAPVGRRNVTDSYAQIQSMFAERASDCEKDDMACVTTPINDENGTNSSEPNNSETKNEEDT